VVYHWVSAAGDQYGCGTYSQSWVRRYLDQGYVRIDPVIAGCYQNFHPVDWRHLDWSGKAAKEFQAESIAHGVGNQGFSIPVRGPNGQFALFTVSTAANDPEWDRFTERNRHDLILVAHAFNERALTFERERTVAHPRGLSRREVEALTLLAEGLSRAQAAEALSISEHTLRVYIEGARTKLGAQNTVHAVARAICQGIIVV
jgi:DNA-binding CsgD family transcriptional regulator